MDSALGPDDACGDFLKDIFSLSFIDFMTRNLSFKGGREEKGSDISVILAECRKSCMSRDKENQ